MKMKKEQSPVIIIAAKYRPSKNIRTLEPFMIKNGKPGKVFYSLQSDIQNAVIAGRHRRHIHTEKVIVISGKMTAEPQAQIITKVTLGEFY